MADNNNRLSRRGILKGIAGGVGAATAAGVASAGGQPDRKIVGLKPGASFSVAERKADSVHRKLDFEHVGKAVAGRFPDEALKGLSNNPNVEYIEDDSTYRALGQTLPWGIDRVDADKVHADGETGGDNTDGEGGADIAILDTGIDSDHPDLNANIGSGKAYVNCGSVGGCRFGAGPNDNTCHYNWDDDNNHGTHCAGTADAEDNSEGVVGVSTAATLHAVKVLDGCGSGSLSDVAAGIEYVADQGWDVASMSLGASSGDSTLKNACQYAYDKGVLLVAAAGNDGPCSDCVGYPAAYSEVIAVSATTKSDSLADFSSTGPEVELAAPGKDIYSTVPAGYDTYSGTSMACPHVSGAGGQLMDNGYTNTEARSQLQSTAEDIGLADNESGYGLLDVEAALSGSTDSAPSVSWVNPADGDTVSGTVTIQIDASDSEDSNDSLTVEYNVDGGSYRTATYNSTSGYYEDSWDTTTVSDGSHSLTARATDSAGNSSTSSISVTTDNTASAPTVDSLSASEVETSDSDAEFDVSWDVSDGDGDLSSVDLTLTDDTAGETEDTASISVSGSSASGTTRLVAAGDDGSGNSYTVDATVTDSNGNTGSGSTSVSETESTSSAPTVDSHSVSTRQTGPWNRVEADWAVSDDDGDLDSVVVAIEDSSGNTLNSTTVDVSGSTASGSNELKTRGTPSESVVTVTDSKGNSDTSSKSV